MNKQQFIKAFADKAQFTQKDAGIAFEAMAETIELLRKELPEVQTVVGGAVLTKEFADKIGATFYAKDAMEAVRFAQR